MKRLEAYQLLLKELTDKRHAKALLCGILEIKREDYMRDPDKIIREEDHLHLKEAIFRANQDEPISKILGKREFWGLDFKTTKDTLDPRPETELMIEQTLSLFPKDKIYRFLELGVGTGCVIISLLKEYLHAQGIGVDISPKALTVAQANLEHHCLADRLQLIESSWFENVCGKYDLILSNPPYIERKDIGNLDNCVKNYDPHLSLDGGVSGLDAYRQIASFAADFLQDQGVIIVEIGAGQAHSIIKIFTDEGFRLLMIKKDLAQIERVLSFTL